MSHFNYTPCSEDTVDMQQISVLSLHHQQCLNQIDLNDILEQRLDKILLAAQVGGEDTKSRIANYEREVSPQSNIQLL